jgi:hypothetical protein
VKRIHSELAIVTPIRGAVIVHAPLAVTGKFSLERIRREKPFVAIFLTMVGLEDPVTLTTLGPGIYAVRLRSIGGRNLVFDFFDDKDRPTLSTIAQTKQDDDGILGLFGLDIDITLPGDPDSFYPPPDNGEFCISILHWRKCWRWGWPDIDWPW